MSKLHKTSTLLTLLAVLPAAAYASLAHAVVLAQIDTAVSAGKELGEKSMATWFVVVAALAITSWFYVFKLTIGQLDQQRATNAELVKQIIDGHKSDNAELKEILKEALSAIKIFSNQLNKQ